LDLNHTRVRDSPQITQIDTDFLLLGSCFPDYFALLAVAIGLAVVGFVSANGNVREVPRFPILEPDLPPPACPRPAVKFALTKATFAFDDFRQPRYDKLWRISVLRTEGMNVEEIARPRFLLRSNRWCTWRKPSNSTAAAFMHHKPLTIGQIRLREFW
jgi:hypothetical protein